MNDRDCLFCRIVSGEISAEIVHETKETIAFRDIAPQAPVHVLVIPKEHVTSLETVPVNFQAVLGELILAVREVAFIEGIEGSGFRTVLNTGPDGGQEVMHMHAHVIGGREMVWPPG